VYDLTPEDRHGCVKALCELLNTDTLKHTIAATFKLKDIALAHESVEQGQLIGNVVIDLRL
jgi:NADPH2:quinone reductase